MDLYSKAEAIFKDSTAVEYSQNLLLRAAANLEYHIWLVDARQSEWTGAGRDMRKIEDLFVLKSEFDATAKATDIILALNLRSITDLTKKPKSALVAEIVEAQGNDFAALMARLAPAPTILNGLENKRVLTAEEFKIRFARIARTLWNTRSKMVRNNYLEIQGAALLSVGGFRAKVAAQQQESMKNQMESLMRLAGGVGGGCGSAVPLHLAQDPVGASRSSPPMSVEIGVGGARSSASPPPQKRTRFECSKADRDAQFQIEYAEELRIISDLI